MFIKGKLKFCYNFSLFQNYFFCQIPVWAGVEYAHRFPAWRMRRLKSFPDDSAFTAWDYAGLLCILYRDAGPKRSHYSQTSRARSPINPFYKWRNMFLTELHHPFVVSIPLFLPSNSFMRAREFIRGNHHHLKDAFRSSA